MTILCVVYNIVDFLTVTLQPGDMITLSLWTPPGSYLGTQFRQQGKAIRSRRYISQQTWYLIKFLHKLSFEKTSCRHLCWFFLTNKHILMKAWVTPISLLSVRNIICMEISVIIIKWNCYGEYLCWFNGFFAIFYRSWIYGSNLHFFHYYIVKQKRQSMYFCPHYDKELYNNFAYWRTCFIGSRLIVSFLSWKIQYI